MSDTGRDKRRWWHGGSITVLIALWATTPAWATPAWNPTAEVSPPGALSDHPAVAIDASGNAVALWLRDVAGTHVVESSDHPAGRSWTAPVAISNPSQESGAPVLALDAAGNAFAAWAQGPDGTHKQIHTSYRPHGGSWQPAGVLGDPNLESVQPALSVDAHGDEVLAWTQFTDSTLNYANVIGAYRPSGGAWTTPQQLSPTSSKPLVYPPSAAIDPQGRAAVVWSYGDATMQPSKLVVQASRYVPGSFFGWSLFTSTLSNTSADNNINPRVAADPNGNLTAIWADQASITDVHVAGSDFPIASNSWSAPYAVESQAGYAYPVGLAFDPSGNAIAVWQLGSASTESLESSTRPAGGGWPGNAATITSSSLGIANFVLSVGSRGDAVLGWLQQHAGSNNYIAEAAVKAAAGAWSAPHLASTASDDAYGAAAAIDSHGNAVELWSASAGSTVVVQGATYSAPTLDGVSIPGSGTAGKRMRFSVSPFDVWSPTTTSWNFGDGTHATGTSVTHTFMSAGHRTVTVTTSNLGHASVTTSRTITIGPSAPVLSKVSQSHTRWARARKLATITAARKLPLGTTFRLTLNEAARLRFSFSRCANRTHRSCKHVGSLSLPGHTGANKVAFYGQLSRTRRLRPGAYAVTITALRAGKRSSAAILRFSIVR